MPRYARVCPNGITWQHPDDGNKGGIGTTFPGTYGFGFEEWLGRDWVWNGPRFAGMDPDPAIDYHCGFIQAFRRQRENIAHDDVELFIIDGNRNRVAVGHIRQCTRLNAAELVDVFNTYAQQGWLATMQTELAAANRAAIQHHHAIRYPHQLANMGHAPGEIFNVYFRVNDIDFPQPQLRNYRFGRYFNLNQ